MRGEQPKRVRWTMKRGCEVTKQGAMRRAPSEQCDYVLEGNEAKPKSNTPVECLPSRNERSEAIKIPSGVPRNQFTQQGGLIFYCVGKGFEA